MAFSYIKKGATNNTRELKDFILCHRNIDITFKSLNLIILLKILILFKIHNFVKLSIEEIINFVNNILLIEVVLFGGLLIFLWINQRAQWLLHIIGHTLWSQSLSTLQNIFHMIVTQHMHESRQTIFYCLATLFLHWFWWSQEDRNHQLLSYNIIVI